jgi:RNA polymerase sigma factor (sigma-70 family)
MSGNAALSDRELAARFVAHRDEHAFRELFGRHTPALYRLAVRLLGGAGRGAEDAVQEAWLRAARRLGVFQWRSSLRTWLCGITVNCCREELRERPSCAPAAPAPDCGEPVQQPQASALGLDLEHAILALADGYREVFVLHDLEGWTHDEIAVRLGIASGTSKSQLSRARRALRRHLTGAADAALEP